MKIFKLIFLFFLSMSRFSLGQDAAEDKKAANDFRVQELIGKLDKTQWTGRSGYFIGAGTGWKNPLVNDAYMVFQVMDGHLYYLSSINKTLDSLIEKSAQGLCVKSPPRRVEFTASEDGRSFSASVYVPTLSKEPKAELKFKKINLEYVLVENDTFNILDYEIDKGKVKLVPTRYLLKKEDSPITTELAQKLDKCLLNKPWLP